MTPRLCHRSPYHDAPRQRLNPIKRFHRICIIDSSRGSPSVPAMLRIAHIPTSVTIAMFAIVLAAPPFVILLVPTLD
jgi:hypothetical protein